MSIELPKFPPLKEGAVLLTLHDILNLMHDGNLTFQGALSVVPAQYWDQLKRPNGTSYFVPEDPDAEAKAEADLDATFAFFDRFVAERAYLQSS